MQTPSWTESVPRPRAAVLTACALATLVIVIHLRLSAHANDSRALAAALLGVPATELRLSASRTPRAVTGGTSSLFELTDPSRHGLKAACARVGPDAKYVSYASWVYTNQPTRRASTDDAKRAGRAFLAARSPLYREGVRLTVDMLGDTNRPRYVVRQAVPSGDTVYFIYVALDMAARPEFYGVAESPREPAPTAPVRLTEEQALAVAQRELARKPGLTVDKVWVVNLSTRSFFAPDGRPVYVVGVNGHHRDASTNAPPSSVSFSWGVDASSGVLLTRWSPPPEAFAPGSAPGSVEPRPDGTPHAN